MTASIKKAFNKHMKLEAKKVKKLSEGHINQMYEINSKYIFRIFNEEWKAAKEEFVYKLMTEVGIPVPDINVVDTSKKIIGKCFSIMSKIGGMRIDAAYRKYRDKKIWEQAGELLARIHKVKLEKFGWIVGRNVNPAFDTWQDFVWYDINQKLKNMKMLKEINSLRKKIEAFLNTYGYLLDVPNKSSLVHKDYHSSHILVDKNKITGIIDVEWAIAGHKENDFVKLEQWVFPKLNIRNEFFEGYLKFGSVSDDYKDRMQLYELWHYISMANISHQINNKKFLQINIKALEKFL